MEKKNVNCPFCGCEKQIGEVRARRRDFEGRRCGRRLPLPQAVV